MFESGTAVNATRGTGRRLPAGRGPFLNGAAEGACRNISHRETPAALDGSRPMSGRLSQGVVELFRAARRPGANAPFPPEELLEARIGQSTLRAPGADQGRNKLRRARIGGSAPRTPRRYFGKQRTGGQRPREQGPAQDNPAPRRRPDWVPKLAGRAKLFAKASPTLSERGTVDARRPRLGRGAARCRTRGAGL